MQPAHSVDRRSGGEIGTVPGAGQGGGCRCTYHASMTAIRAVIDPALPRSGLWSGTAKPLSCARAGKMAKRTARRVVSRQDLRPAHTSRNRSKALFVMRLAIRAGRAEPRRRTPGGVGAPPENGPCLHSRAFRGGHSQDFSLQEGGMAPRGRGGVRHPRPERHSLLSGSAIRVEVQACVFTCTGASATPAWRRALILRTVARAAGRPPTDSSASYVQARIALRMRSSSASSAPSSTSSPTSCCSSTACQRG